MKLGTLLLEICGQGLYCPPADIFIDPWYPVEKAVITHGHSDHARFGHKKYFAHKITNSIMRSRISPYIVCEDIPFGKEVNFNGVKVSLHPAGHIPGSAQVRLEYKGEICVISGDYKTQNDGISGEIEIVKCHTFITESTFGLPVYNWKTQSEIFNDINDWWKRNKENGKSSVLTGYSLGKAQRILANVDRSIGKFFGHGSITVMTEAIRKAGLSLPPLERVTGYTSKKELAGALIIAPPSALGSPWVRKFEPYAAGNASGWMNIRGAKRWQALDAGFALSDHADWKGLNSVIKETGAENIYVTHGFTSIFSRWLKESGYNAFELSTKFKGESIGETPDEPVLPPAAGDVPMHKESVGKVTVK